MSNYLEYLEESTNTVKSKVKLSKLILIITDFVIWAMALVVSWLFISGADAMGYSFMFLWVLLPVTTLMTSILIGKNDYWGNWKWVATIVFGVMYMFADYATFSVLNMARFGGINMPNFSMMLIGTFISLVGFAVGIIINYFRTRVNN
jgi:hypothetical protein